MGHPKIGQKMDAASASNCSQKMSTPRAFRGPQAARGGGKLLLSHAHQCTEIVKDGSCSPTEKKENVNVSVPMLSLSCQATESQAFELPLASVGGEKH